MMNTEQEPMLLSTFDGARHSIVRELSIVETNAAMRALRALNRLSDDFQIMLVVVQNVQTFTENFQRYVDELTEQRGMGEERLAHVALDMNRHLTNALSAFTMFLDHANIEIVHRFGKGGSQHRQFTARRNEHYAGVFAYRLLYELRNYTLHVGMPIRVVRAESRLEPDGRRFNALTLTVDAVELRDRSNKWTLLAAEIAERGVFTI
jgi:hypothetical protein